jgi:type III pantothenate kinase
MKLAIDVGNTNITFGLFEDSTLEHQWRIRTVWDKTADEYRVLFDSFLDSVETAANSVDQVILSSVVPSLTDPLSDMVQEMTGKDALVVGPGIKTGLRIRTDNPSEVGADLVANAVAAYRRFQANCIAIGAGTALTFTAVNADGDMQGVVIAPGLNAAADALKAHTAQLPQVRLKPPKTVIGKNSIHSIQSGLMYGYAGLVSSLIDRIKNELGGEARVVATGGQGFILSPLVEQIEEHDPWLTLKGLNILGELNR